MNIVEEQKEDQLSTHDISVEEMNKDTINELLGSVDRVQDGKLHLSAHAKQ